MSNRKYVGHIGISGISPKKNYKGTLDDLKTIGLKLNHEETECLIKLLQQALLNNSTDWEYLNVTGYRNTDQLTVTYYKHI